MVDFTSGRWYTDVIRCNRSVYILLYSISPKMQPKSLRKRKCGAMNITELYFSPTGGTRKAADLLTGALEGQVQTVDLCDSRSDFSAVTLGAEDLAVIAVPSYGGRVPAVAIQRLSAVHGNGAAAVLMVVYGNRAFEDTMVELEDAARQAGFGIVAGVAAVAEHSIARQFAAGRPDAQDQTQLTDFASRIQEKLAAGSAVEPAIPGNRPYKKAGGSGMVPKPTKDCVSCGLCAESCPVQAIDPADPEKVDGHACISCMRCVSVCPHNARKVNPIMMAAVNTMLKKVCSTRKENELFL